jgi:indole-3-glycerol phosphate synthase
MPPVSRLSQAIAEGESISILVEVHDAESAGVAERQGADGLAVRRGASAVRASSQLPLLHFGGTTDASGAAADAVVVSPDLALWDEAHALGLECVVRVTRDEELELALDELDPGIFLLSTEPDSDDDPLEALLALLHDVPAGKLAIAELHEATAEDVAELERAGVDAVLVHAGDVAALVPAEPPDV